MGPGLVVAVVLGLVAPGAPPVEAEASAGAGHGPVCPLVFVSQRFAGKNNVRWWRFDWRSTEFTPVEGGAPVRLYFYNEQIARPALAATDEAYREYVERFGYTPRRLVPYLLYNSHFEFQSTTAFFISERVLGVTAVEELTTALPYWGDHHRFRHILRHELAHQFTIQKVNDTALVAGRRGADVRASPLQLMPLWFVEGTAEFHAQPGLTPEVRAVLFDRLRAGEDRPALGGFFDVFPLDFERVYLIGHAQARFLEEEFGAGTNRRIHDGAVRLTTLGDPAFGSFPALVASVTGASAEAIDERFQAWARREVERQAPWEASPALSAVEGIDHLVDSFSLAPDGRTLFLRTFELETGRTRLLLRDLDDAGSTRVVDFDQRIGMYSMHALDRRVTAIAPGVLAWIGRVADADRLFVARWRREERDGRVRYELGRVVEHELSDHFDLIEAGYPALEPDGSALAFVGLGRDAGFLDVFRVELPLERGARVVRVTSDEFVDRDLEYLPDGTLVTSSDATPTRAFELFRLSPDGRRTALTQFAAPADVRHPADDREGGLVFVADATGFTQPHRRAAGRVVRIGGAPTMVQQAAVAHDGGLVALSLVRGERRLLRIPRSTWLSEPSDAFAEQEVEPAPLAMPPLGPVEPYRPFRWQNFSLSQAQGFLAGTNFGAALVSFDDLFRDHTVGAQVQYFGGLELLNANAFYVNRAGRLTTGFSFLVDTGLQVDPTAAQPDSFFLLQRTGPSFLAAFPFGRYSRLQGFVAPQALRAYRFAPGSPLAAIEGTYSSLRAGLGFGVDTLRAFLPVGPFDGWSLLAEADGTILFGGPESFVRTSLKLNGFRPILRRYPRIYLHGRFSFGAIFGGALAEQHFLPPEWNLRGLVAERFSDLIGRQYLLATAELRFPLDRLIPFLPFVEGVMGGDAGAIANELEGLRTRRLVNAVVGVNFGLAAGLALRLHFARPFDIGGLQPVERWRTLVSFSTPLLF
jgi:hypothetical protein